MEIKILSRGFSETPLKTGAKFVLIGVVLLTFWSFGSLWVKTSELNKSNHENPLLLSSGLVTAKEAELRIILWFDKGKPSELLLESLPKENWVWQASDSANSLGTAFSIAGYTKIDRESEQAIYLWYQGLVEMTGEAGGIAYLDERVPEGMDIAQYALKQNILPRQFTLSEGIYSMVGWQESYLPQVVAGNDSINIQLISQGYGQGKTALAIPVLLEEF